MIVEFFHLCDSMSGVHEMHLRGGSIVRRLGNLFHFVYLFSQLLHVFLPSLFGFLRLQQGCFGLLLFLFKLFSGFLELFPADFGSLIGSYVDDWTLCYVGTR